MNAEIRERLQRIYGDASVADTLEATVRRHRLPAPSSDGETLPLDEKSAVMITYGDSLRDPGGDASPLGALKEFSDRYLRPMVSTIHILPFSPFSSDDGFSVIDYREIGREFGDWPQMAALGEHFGLQFDLVLNHCSQESEWFKGFLAGDPKYKEYFITADPADPDLKKVFRPRALPLLHAFETSEGEKWVWTTFSRDQVDLNFANPEVLVEFVDILLFYIEQGARIIRLDAVGFLWKELGTPCMHHAKTHEVIKLLRSLLRAAAPDVVLLTETNVPHKENISYFGDGTDEAQMVYQFALPPLTLDAYICGDATHLTEWAKTLPQPDGKITFFNFLASHDGIGMLPARGILSGDEQKNLIGEVQRRGGKVSYKSTPDGDIPYELNISYCDAVAEKELDDGMRARKFLSAQSTLLVMAGVPGIYVHSLLGSGNWQQGVEESGINRRINREKLNVSDVEKALADPGSLRSRIYSGFKTMLEARATRDAFNPASSQEILSLDSRVFAVRRTGKRSRVLCLSNASGDEVELDIVGGQDILTGENRPEVRLAPYETVWLV